MNSLSDPASKILQHVDRLAQFKYGLAYPISAEVDLTKRCALNCFGCHSKWTHVDDPSTDMQPEAIMRVLTQLHRFGCHSVTFSGGGDPFESPHWRYAINLARDLGFDIAAYSYLPGLNQEMVDFIEDKRLAFVYTHSNNSKGLTHSPKSKTVWTYGWLLDSSNCMKVFELVGKTNLDFYNFVDFRPLAPENKPDAEMLNYDWVPTAMRMLESAVQGNPKVKFAKYKFEDLMKPNFGRDYHRCYSTDFTCSVSSNGDMPECLNRRGFSDSILGNILTEDLDVIWKRKARFREDMSQCRILCRNHEMNKTLDRYVFVKTREPDFSNFA